MPRIYAAMDDELLVISAEGGYSQVESRLEGYRPQCLAADPLRPELLYCGTREAGLWRSTDGGYSWEPVGEGVSSPNVTAVAVSAAERIGERIGGRSGEREDEPGVVYAGTEPSALYASEDGGGSWRELSAMLRLPSYPEWSFPPKPHTSHVRWISPDPATPARVFVCIEAGALIHSDDGGESWRDRVSDGPIDTHTLAVREDAPGRLYSAAGDGVFYTGYGYSESPDAGASWERYAEGLAHHYLWGLAVDPADPDTVLVSAATGPRQAHSPDAAESTIYRRQGAGPWQEVTDGPPRPEGMIALVLASNPEEPGVFYAINNHGLYRSLDAGLRWQRLQIPWSERYLRHHPGALVVSADGR